MYEKSKEHGIINDKMPTMAENTHRISCVEAKKNPKSRVLRLSRIIRRQLDDIVYLPEPPRKRRNQRRRETLSHLNGSTGHPATGIIPSQERNISETLQLSYL